MAEIGPLEFLAEVMNQQWVADELNRQQQRVIEGVLYGNTWTAATINELVQEPCGCWYRLGERFKLCPGHVRDFLAQRQSP